MVVDTEVKESDETHEESDAVMADIAGDAVCNTSENVYEQSLSQVSWRILKNQH